ncbi:50S ribosome-binding GTPase [Microcoleus sp. FACHB-53]|nr:50S ribosome-binding GTPase [Microcoleus sp. FACHB-53]
MDKESLEKIEASLNKIRSLLNKISKFINVNYPLTKINEIEETIKLLRPPRFLIIGRRGSGKSTLINAMIGKYECDISDVGTGTKKPEWQIYKHNNRELSCLDTRGFQDPLDHQEISGDQIWKIVKKCCPDVVLFLCKATEVDAAIDKDLACTEEILKKFKSHYHREIPLIGVVTQCDQLAPHYIRLPTEDKKKTQNIEKAKDILREHIQKKLSSARLSDVIATVAYAEYAANKEIKVDVDYRWNIEEQLMEVLLKLVPPETKPELEPKCLADLAKEFVNVIRNVVSILAPVVSSASQIPGVSLVIVLIIQVNMVKIIANMGGDNNDIKLEDAVKFLVMYKGMDTIVQDVNGDFIESAVSIISQVVSEQGVIQGMEETLLQSIPFIGPLINSFLSADATQKLGEAAISYYILNEDTPPDTQTSLAPVPAY